MIHLFDVCTYFKAFVFDFQDVLEQYQNYVFYLIVLCDFHIVRFASSALSHKFCLLFHISLTFYYNYLVNGFQF